MAATDRDIIEILIGKMGLTSLDAKYDNDSHITKLNLSDRNLSQLPGGIGQLSSLQHLDLDDNQLRELPPKIGRLSSLEVLDSGGNQLRELPPEIGRLSSLKRLHLSYNQLRELPPEIGQLTNLRNLSLHNNQLSHLPREIGYLASLQNLSLYNNSPLQSPPPEIIAQGTPAILAYLRGLQEKTTPRYEVKLLIIGEGGTGKSSLLRALRNQHFDAVLSTTHGIEVDSLKLSHPNKKNTNVILNTWDFGGQQIYHATHQFFLTKRSMYIVTWNARLGVKQSRLDYWLETIQVLAPDAPVLLVATHIDERAADINYAALKEQYPQLVGHLSISNANGILQHSELRRIWQTDDDGHPYQQRLYPVFLRLMERFYLSYQIEADTPGARSTRSLIPQLLPYQPLATLPLWPSSPPAGQTQIEMRYQLSIVPSGVMSWFIVRTHLYTQEERWREGVLLTYQDHFARVELNENRKEIRLLVWGTQPHNFFTILMNTIDVILDFFSGLTIRREVPCICHWQRQSNEPCSHFFSYEELKRRMEAKRHSVECPQSFEQVSVRMLLYGIHTSTDPQVMQDIQTGRREVLQGLREIKQDLGQLNKLDIILNNQSELIGRNFTRQWNYEMKKLEAECPNTFFLLPGSGNLFNPKNWVGEEYQLFLLCQHPPHPHQAGDGYKLRKAADWWLTVSPWLNHALIFLKYAVPLAGGAEKIINPDLIKAFQDQIDLLEEILDDLPDLGALESMSSVTRHTLIIEGQQAEGPALRALHTFLKEQDPNETWGGLHITPTPDGNILWLCSDHRRQYEAKQAAI